MEEYALSHCFRSALLSTIVVGGGHAWLETTQLGSGSVLEPYM